MLERESISLSSKHNSRSICTKYVRNLGNYCRVDIRKWSCSHCSFNFLWKVFAKSVRLTEIANPTRKRNKRWDSSWDVFEMRLCCQNFWSERVECSAKKKKASRRGRCWELSYVRSNEFGWGRTDARKQFSLPTTWFAPVMVGLRVACLPYLSFYTLAWLGFSFAFARLLNSQLVFCVSAVSKTKFYCWRVVMA